MRKTLTLAAALFVAASLHAAELTVDDILAKNAASKGGLEKLQGVSSMKMTGKMSFGPMEAPFVLSKKRPASMKVDFTIQGMTASQAFDGTTGWAVMPFLGKKEAEEMGGDELKAVKEQADFDGPFIDYAKKGNKIELVGQDQVEGSPAYKLKLLTREGTESVVYLDATTFLEIRIESKRKVQGQEVETVTTIGNYQEVEGMLFPFWIESKSKGAPAGQVITIDKLELNSAMDDEAFRMPVKKAAAVEVH
jgi:outer membrane lipoprotein-sorting protein